MRPLAVALVLAFGSGVVACGGEPSRLITVKAGTGEGPIDFSVKNSTDVAINALFIAKTQAVTDPNLDPNSPDGQSVWGPDLLHSAIPVGERVPIPVKEPGRWDVRAVDRDDRFQHVTGLKLEAGGRYILELNEGGWRVR